MITVSALMPTYNRREFIPRAISCFLAQEYPADWSVELVVLDDGSDPVKDLLPDDPRIKYFRETTPQNHGIKMNRCCELASGEYLIVWDDDDFYIPTRLARQIQPMVNNQQIQITGTRTLYYYKHGEQKAWQYTSPQGIDWLASIAFRKSEWERQRFDMIKAGADYNFTRKVPKEARCDLSLPTLVVASIHGQNACQKHLGSGYVPVPWEKIETLWRMNEPARR